MLKRLVRRFMSLQRHVARTINHVIDAVRSIRDIRHVMRAIHFRIPALQQLRELQDRTNNVVPFQDPLAHVAADRSFADNPDIHHGPPFLTLHCRRTNSWSNQ